MRLWTLHPSLLDSKGLVALWREGLLAQAVIRGQTSGYRHHPQLLRFLATDYPEATIATYLVTVQEEATQRGYRFDPGKIGGLHKISQLEETDGQLGYEWSHLLRKLKSRDPLRYEQLRHGAPHAHPLFNITCGAVREWEKIHPLPP